MNSKLISDIQKYGKTARGKKELIRHLQGQRLTQRQAILAKCFDCCGFYSDGRADCKCPQCSLYPFQPFNKNKQKRNTSAGREQNMSSLLAEASVGGVLAT